MRYLCDICVLCVGFDEIWLRYCSDMGKLLVTFGLDLGMI